MKDEYDDLLSELARLRPAQPSERLKQRIAEELSARSEPCVWTWFVGLWGSVAELKWLGAAAAIGVTVLIVALVVQQASFRETPNEPAVAEQTTSLVEHSSDKHSNENRGPNLDLVSSANYLIQAEDQGLIEGGTPVPLRKVTWEFISASEFRDRQENAIVQVFVPRRETVLIPVNLH